MSLDGLQLRGSTPKEQILAKHARVVNSFNSGVTRDIQWRKQQLRNLYYAIQDNEDALKQALVKDLHRAPEETEFLELHLIYSEINLAISKVDEWAADESLGRADLRFALASPTLQKNPYGAVLIIGPWNYPYLCTLVPIASAIAAGNTVALKPTEMAPYSTTVLSALLEKALNPDTFQVITGSVAETTVALEQKWDRIMLTGSSPVGKIVATAAAKHLTPVTLELGGKSPVIVTRKADIPKAAKRIAWGKFANAGQTCVAPDYVVVDEDVKDEFVSEMDRALKKFYPNLTKDTGDYAHIVSDRLYERMCNLVSNSKGKVVITGTPDRESKFYPPTVVTDVTLEDSLMQEEVFGPVLPILSSKDVMVDSNKIISSHDHPLALYVFTNDKKQADQILNSTRSGAAMINDVVVQGGSPTIPFGGVGNSGTGRYHGKFGFDEFTYARPVLRQPNALEPALTARYPPFRPGNIKRLKFLAVPYAWFSRTGVVKKPLFWKLLTKWWVVVLVVVALKVRL